MDIDPKWTNDLFDALAELVDAISWADVLEVGGDCLQRNYEAANELLEKIEEEA